MKYFAKTSPEMTKEELQHMELSRKVAGECIVLLENNGVLPLADQGKIALFGTGARRTVKGGTGSGDVNSRFIVTIEQAIEEAGFNITTKAWMDRFDQKCADEISIYREMVAKEAKETGRPEFIVEFEKPMKPSAPELITDEDIENSDTDTAIYVISRNSGEGADRNAIAGDYYFCDEEIVSLKKLGKNYKNVILVLNIGGVMDLSVLDDIDGLSAVVLMTQLGNIGGYALTDVLVGKVTPSGKLVDTWAKKYEDYPSSEGFSHNDGNVDDEYYTEGIYVGYRYFDSFDVKPVYPFGYGKSYTEFFTKIEGIALNGNEVNVDVLVKNIGEVYAGKEVVQIYYSAPQGKLAKPYQELATYKKSSSLAPGEEEVLNLSFKVSDMASYCESCSAWVLEAGDYILRVGTSSKDTFAAAKLSLAETVITEQLKPLFAIDIPFDEMDEPVCDHIKEEVPLTLQIDSSAIKTYVAQYQKERVEFKTDFTEKLTMQDVLSGKCTIEDLTAQLSVEEMAEYCVGTSRLSMSKDDLDEVDEKGEASIVGSASHMVPGAAGDTTALLLQERGIGTMALADGPAGLRLTHHFVTNPEGEIISAGLAFGTQEVEREYPEDSIHYYQYCTVIPIGWALAQSWNENLLEEIGDMVGQEMKTFGVELWLAPAMNIHRNPLCGRNFEYYSEDPLVAGKAAAAITRGVQKNTGKGTTIKHFAVNSQEDNRYFSNAHVHERALREIYLKGFEIAVKESQPLSIMTSYNLINGIHAANSYDLLQSLARDEWGFEGVVMTDWFTSQDVPEITGGFNAIYPISASTGCIKAGNELQMPGCQKNVDDIVEAVYTGKEIDGYTITKADLQQNMKNILNVIAKTMV